MANIKISELPAATVPLSGTEEVPIVQGGVTKRVATDAIGDTVLDEFAASSGSSLVGFLQAGTGAQPRTAQSKMRDVVSVKDFGAVGDGVTDDTAAIQAAINYCLTFTRPAALLFPSRCRIAAPLIVDRMVDTTVSDFIWYGAGPGAGLSVDTAITMIDSSLTVTADPKSESIVFQNMDFSASSSALAAYVISQKFLRVSFSGCNFRQIKCLNASIYVQTWRFTNCTARQWSGNFFTATKFYDLHSIGGIYEFGGPMFDCFTTGANGCSLIGNLYEGSTGPFWKSASSEGVAVVGNYTEGNTTGDYVFTNLAGGGQSKGVHFSGNACMTAPSPPAGLWAVVWGDVRGGFSSGNYSNHQLHDNTGTFFGELVSVSDFAVTSLSKIDNFIESMSDGAAIRAEGISARAGGGQTNAAQLTKPVNRVTVAASAGDSVKLPATSSTTGKGMVITIINDSPNSIQVFGSGADSINFSPSATGVAQASGTVKTYYQSTFGRWSV